MSRSKARRRSVLLQSWLTPEEAATIRHKAGDAGVSVSELLRMALFRYKPPATKIDKQAVAKLSAEIGKIGSNINQIAYHLNAGRPGDRVEGSLDEALRELLEWRTALMQALGERKRRVDDKDATSRP